MVLNEILPRPDSDWNGDGTVNNYDEFIEVENLGPGIVDLSNWKLDVMPNGGSSPFILPSRKLNSNECVVFFGSTTHLLLEDSGDTVRLIDLRGVIEDAFTYPAVLQPDDSWCRTHDGIGFWRDGCFPTPEIENALSGILPPPQPGGEVACQLPDVAPGEFRLAECNGSGANIWNQKYWNDLSGQNEYEVPDSKSKAKHISNKTKSRYWSALCFDSASVVSTIVLQSPVARTTSSASKTTSSLPVNFSFTFEIMRSKCPE